jgi:pentatricopeptide repeat protein
MHVLVFSTTSWLPTRPPQAGRAERGAPRRLPEVEMRFAQMRRAGIAPTARSFNALLEAAKRAGRPGRAAAVLHGDMAAAGVAPDVASWNTLLGAYGRNGDVDGAHATWQARAPLACAKSLCQFSLLERIACTISRARSLLTRWYGAQECIQR